MLFRSQDNVFLRLMPQAYALGVVDKDLYQRFLAEKQVIEVCLDYVRSLPKHHDLVRQLMTVDFTEEIKKSVYVLLAAELVVRNINTKALSSRALLCIHAELRYAGYIQKEICEVQKFEIYQSLVVPAELKIGRAHV